MDHTTDQPPSLPQPGWALITNATPDTLAEALTQTFLTRGINVIATSPIPASNKDEDKWDEHVSATPGTTSKGFLIRLHVDPITAVELVEQLTNGKLSYLLNCPASNHGSGYSGGPLLDVDISQARSAYEANVWAPLAITQAFFPLLRRGKGIVVNWTSVAGLQGYSRPYTGVHSSNQAAMRSLNDIMRVEFEPFGVRVVGVVSGAESPMSMKVGDRSPYVLIKDDVENAMLGESGHDRFEVAEKIVDALLQETTPTFVRVGYWETLMWLIHWLLPVWVLDGLHRNGSGLGKLKGMLNADADDGKKED